MRHRAFEADTLLSLLQERRVATMEQMKGSSAKWVDIRPDPASMGGAAMKAGRGIMGGWMESLGQRLRISQGPS